MGLLGFQWAGVAERLKLHGLWTAEVERGLTVCESLMIKYETEEHERNTKRRQASNRKR